MKKWFIVGLVLVLHLGIANSVLSYTVIGYGPSEYLGGSPAQLAAMETNLGISGLVIEDFFDLDLVPGLTITGPTYGGTNFWPNAWGDPNSGSFIAYPTSIDFATIEITPGADMVGIGLGYLEYWTSIHSIMTINNDEVIVFTPENFPNFDFGVLPRNGYITIARDVGDPPISSIIFKTSTSHGDAYTFDYVAIEFSSVPPIANAGSDQNVDADSACTATVTLDGSNSIDLNSTPETNDDIVSFEWYEGTTLLGSGETLDYSFSLGVHTVTLVVTDNAGETDSDEVIITVVDTTPPQVTAELLLIGKSNVEDEGVYRIQYDCSDNCDTDVTPTAEIKCSVYSGDEFKWKSGKGFSDLDVASFSLVVSCEDSSGNVGIATAAPQ